MTVPPRSEDLLALARRIIWFEPPEKALVDPLRSLVYLMTYGTWDDIVVARRHLTEAEFREALEKAPPGIFDPRSWAYWNLVIAGRSPPPPLPRRVIP
jgi:hypothetical protein